MSVPNVIVKWCIANDISLEEFRHEYEGEEWRTVSEEIFSAEKYNNVDEIIIEHVPTGRFFRLYHHSLPYGITDYGMEPEDEEDIVEVFPVEVTVTKYFTVEELKSQ